MKPQKLPKYFDGKSLGLLSGPIDRYRGIKIDEESISNDGFKKQLESSVEQFRHEGMRAIWLKLSNQRAHLIGTAIQDAGFSFHHAKDNYVMMTKWLSEEPNKLPGFASHYVGVGGLVMNKDRTKLLCIQEQKPLIKGLWKLPGGLVENGESIQEASVREVWEETGVKTKFVSIMGFRELLSYQWGQQDLYFVCLLEPESEVIDIQMKDEIAQADWITLDQLEHYQFTKMATNVCRLLRNAHHIKAGDIDFSKMPLGDLFRDYSFTFEQYEMLGVSNNFYSPEYIKLAGKYAQSNTPKL